MGEKELVMARLDAARQKMRAALAGLDPHMPVYPGWEVKHVLAHITGWDEATTSSLRAHAGGREPAVPASRGIDEYNAQSVATRQELTYDQIAREWELARSELQAAILALPPEKFKEPLLLPWGAMGTVSQVAEIFAHHEEAHAEEIEKLGRAFGERNMVKLQP